MSAILFRGGTAKEEERQYYVCLGVWTLRLDCLNLNILDLNYSPKLSCLKTALSGSFCRSGIKNRRSQWCKLLQDDPVKLLPGVVVECESMTEKDSLPTSLTWKVVGGLRSLLATSQELHCLSKWACP